jgi:hypothetical protein
MIATKVFALFLLIFSFAAGAPAQESIYRLETGTKLRVRLDTEINSRVSSVNDTFLTKTVRDVVVRDTVVLPAGTVIEGRVAVAEPAGYSGKGGRLAVVFESMRIGAETRAIEAVPVRELKAARSGLFGWIAVVGSTAAGALIGAVSGAENGALIGAGIGAGVGSGAAIAKKGKEIRLKTDEEFEIVLQKPVLLPVRDF